MADDLKLKHVSQTILLTFFYLHFPIPLIVSDSPSQFYNPTDQTFLDCGISGNATQFGDTRTWSGDVDSKFFPSQLGLNTKSVALTSDIQSSGIEKVPYLTARLSRSEFTYIFPATPGQKFIRLYFYPATYSNFERHKAVFSVRAGKYTLLRDFNASVNADYSGEDGIYREFCMNLDEKDTTFNITFTPSTSEDSYAFVSGIEIVSMPDNLYYTPPQSTIISDQNFRGTKFIGHDNLFFPIENYTILENVYRQNIGGNAIPAVEDTGMYRIWNQMWNLYDYLEDAGPLNTSIKLNFSKIANYTAPEDVYTTAQSMGSNATLNKSYNLTWLYLVDSGFQYLIRLHFCEIEAPINNPGERVFLIYIRDFIAEDTADVIQWAGGKGIPIYKDYIVSVFDSNNEKKVNLSVKLQANPQVWRTKWLNAILNGVEIFKLNDSNGNLAGQNPDPITTTPQSSPSMITESKKSKSKTMMILKYAIIAGVGVFAVLGLLLGFIILRRKNGCRDQTSTGEASWLAPLSFSTNKSSKTRNSTLPYDLCRYFTLSEIKSATRDFDDIFIIGVGGFGKVYKGYIDDGATQVAIKRLKPGSKQGAHEFKTEIEMLSQLRHLHLVSLIGYCNDDNEMILVYDYMSNGTLQSHLYGSNDNKPPLPWIQRLKICIGAARGLHYLHTGAKHMIIHRDVKTTNILLDDKWVTKVSDFGLSKVGPTGMSSKAHVSTKVKGSFGYLDPEYYKRQQLTEKSDVYSFGVVLCEILCARPPFIRNSSKKQASLADWFKRCHRENTVGQIIDPTIKNEIAPECLKKFVEIAVNCLNDEGSRRQSMTDVVWALEFAAQLQEASKKEIVVWEGEEWKESDEECLLKFFEEKQTSVVSSAVVKTSSSFDYGKMSGNGTVFSEINDPKGR